MEYQNTSFDWTIQMAFWTSRFVQSNGSILKSLKITATALLDELDKPIGVNGKDTTNLTRKVTYRLTILNHPVMHCLLYHNQIKLHILLMLHLWLWILNNWVRWWRMGIITILETTSSLIIWEKKRPNQIKMITMKRNKVKLQ